MEGYGSRPGWLLLAAACAFGIGSCSRGGAPASSASSGHGAALSVVAKSSGVRMVCLPGGTFVMGDDHGRPDEAPAHKITVSGFAIDATPVTHEMFAKAQLPDPSHWQDDPQGPVERVRWRDAKEYCNERSRLDGLKPCYNEKTPDWACDYSADGYRLPTEAEWEYAARAGSNAAGPPTSTEALRQESWFAENSAQRTHPVGQKRPNAWGLSDMTGNVSVWCEDVYDPGYYARSPAVDPRGPAAPPRDVKRVLRGGNWKAAAQMCPVTRRQGERTGDTDACFASDYCGLRCVRRLTKDEAARLQQSAGR